MVPCLDKCVSSGGQMAVLISLAARFGGLSTDPNVLIANARCFECIPNKLAVSVLASLGAQIAGFPKPFLPPSSPPEAASCPDSDATAFLHAAGIVDSLTVNAICNLVGTLKSSGLWTMMDAIYPFVGSSPTSASINLKNPSAFPITWHGGVTFSPAGVKGDGTTGYGDTGFNGTTAGVNFSLNSGACGFYSGTNVVVAESWIGCSDSTQGIGLAIGKVSVFDPAPNAIGGDVNSQSAGFNHTATFHGFAAASRAASNAFTIYAPDGTSVTANLNSTIIPNLNIFLLCSNSSGSALGFSSQTCGFAFISGGLTGAQFATLQGLVTTFNTSLGRS